MLLFNTYSKPIVIGFEVCDGQTGKHWSGPFSTMETADEIIRNLAPLYPSRKFCVNTVPVQRTRFQRLGSHMQNFKNLENLNDRK